MSADREWPDPDLPQDPGIPGRRRLRSFRRRTSPRSRASRTRISPTSTTRARWRRTGATSAVERRRDEDVKRDADGYGEAKQAPPLWPRRSVVVVRDLRFVEVGRNVVGLAGTDTGSGSGSMSNAGSGCRRSRVDRRDVLERAALDVEQARPATAGATRVRRRLVDRPTLRAPPGGIRHAESLGRRTG